MAKILIAEDDRVSQRLALKIIEEMGHQGFISPHGKHALEALTTNKDFDLLLTDIMMPEMDGQELIQALRNNPDFAGLPIIIMSAVVGIKDISNLLTAGATLFLAKPLKREELQDYLGRCLTKKNCDMH